jgi:bacterial/archaeal transporter family-2 protein
MAQNLPYLLVLTAGVAIAFQYATNALLGRMTGSWLLATVINFCVGLVLLGAALLVLRPRTNPGWVAAAPWYLWLGGLYGALFVFAGAWATPKLGAGTVLVLLVAAQIVAGAALDHVGVLGLKSPIRSAR